MEYSPRNAIPYISRVDAGTVELVRSFGAEVVGSGDLIQLFESTRDDAAWQSHLESAEKVRVGFDVAWTFIASEIRQQGSVSEMAVQNAIMEHFSQSGLCTDHPPIVGVGPHSGDPHYAPGPETDIEMKEGDLVLLDC